MEINVAFMSKDMMTSREDHGFTTFKNKRELNSFVSKCVDEMERIGDLQMTFRIINVTGGK